VVLLSGAGVCGAAGAPGGDDLEAETGMRRRVFRCGSNVGGGFCED
jgi:hypothetical protein